MKKRETYPRMATAIRAMAGTGSGKGTAFPGVKRVAPEVPLTARPLPASMVQYRSLGFKDADWYGEDPSDANRQMWHTEPRGYYERRV